MNANLFAVPVGANFGQAVLNGLDARFGDLPPEQFARIEILVNTRRTHGQLRAMFDAGPPRLLPRVRLITDLANDPAHIGLPAAVSTTRRHLELSKLVGHFLRQTDSPVPLSARFDLATTLASLFDEMVEEGVDVEALRTLDVADESGHWEQALRFVTLVQDHFENQQITLTAAARQSRAISNVIAGWQDSPPRHPLIIAGSTGSRGTTARLMRAVARLPNGYVILPGFDPHLPKDAWDKLHAETGGEDHPHFRIKQLCDALNMHPVKMPYWNECQDPDTERGRLVSLSLRPAPVTDQWIIDGPALGSIADATQGLSLLEAPSPRAEAAAIAVRIRQAVEDRKTAALVTPDRVLARQVTAALGRWGIVPDDSAGIPLQLTPPGRFLRLTARLFSAPVTALDLLVLLKHPLCHSGAERGPHNLHTTALELSLRRNGPAFPKAEDLLAWVDTADEQRKAWAVWLSGLLAEPDPRDLERPLSERLAEHIRLTEALSAGPGQTGSGAFWDREAGRALARAVEDLQTNADTGGHMTAQDYVALLDKILSGEEVRNPDNGRPDVLIWGTLEVRSQFADLVILGGMNEGSWPEAPSPDPWLNRRMRIQAGLRLPERQIGLSAHDYQMAMSAPEVLISRAVRSDEAETVASRWVNRLKNLLHGLPETGGRDCLKQMTARGDALLAIARDIEKPRHDPKPANRPSPRPPSKARPRRLSITEIKTLIRDPYGIYARHVLGLNALDPLTHSANAALRGNILHSVLERFVRDGPAPDDGTARAELIRIAEEILAQECPWPAEQRLWMSRIERFTDLFLADEVARRAEATPTAFEIRGEVMIDSLDFRLVGKADRIDIAEDGAALVYDYKSGTPPTKDMQKHFDTQLLLEAAMIERGAFADIGARSVRSAEFLGLTVDTSNGRLKSSVAPFDEVPIGPFWDRFVGLIRNWMLKETGYTSRRSNLTVKDTGRYDHLARYGEWDESSPPVPEDLE